MDTRLKSKIRSLVSERNQNKLSKDLSAVQQKEVEDLYAALTDVDFIRLQVASGHLLELLEVYVMIINSDLIASEEKLEVLSLVFDALQRSTKVLLQKDSQIFVHLLGRLLAKKNRVSRKS